MKRAAAALVFSRVVDDYLTVRQRDLRPSSHVLSSRHLNQHWRSLHGLAINSINRPIVAATLRELQAANGIVAANRAPQHALGLVRMGDRRRHMRFQSGHGH